MEVRDSGFGRAFGAKPHAPCGRLLRVAGPNSIGGVGSSWKVNLDDSLLARGDLGVRTKFVLATCFNPFAKALPLHPIFSLPPEALSLGLV